MVTHVAKRLVQPFTDFSQFQSIEVKQFQSAALHIGQIVKGTLQSGKIEPGGDIAFNVAGS